MQALQAIAESKCGLFTDYANSDGQEIQPRTPICAYDSPEVDGAHDASTHPYLRIFTGMERRGSLSDANKQPRSFPITGLHVTPESTDAHGVMRRLLQQEGLDLDEKTILQILEKEIDIQAIFKAGLKALLHDTLVNVHSSTTFDVRESCAANSAELRTDKILVVQNTRKEYVASVPDIHRNNIGVKQVLFVAACIANASLLGLSVESLDCCSAKSPFFRNSISESAAKAACLSDFQHLKPHLRPCVAQLMYRHHPYIDVLPFPTVRERLIKLACDNEPMIDEDEFCNDLENDGLICWGSSVGSGSSVVGSGAPWDVRSWEAQDWFVKKWWILIGGAEGEIFKQTQWWREMRGERSCYPW